MPPRSKKKQKNHSTISSSPQTIAKNNTSSRTPSHTVANKKPAAAGATTAAGTTGAAPPTSTVAAAAHVNPAIVAKQQAAAAKAAAKAESALLGSKEFSAEDVEKTADLELGSAAAAAGEDAEIFSSYQPARINLGIAHPDSCVETAALSAVSPPDGLANLLTNLPDETVQHGLLSNVQLEFLEYANMRHEQRLPGGKRAGFLLGDGAGMGKGRQIAGLIFSNIRNNKTAKHLWLSASADLADDARRDFDDIGGGNIPVCNMSTIPPKDDISSHFKHGVLFCTYSCLIGKGCASQTRLDQLNKWTAEFDGCMVFDECHKAKNLLPSKREQQDNSNKGSQTGKAVAKIQEDNPDARVVYVSATGASDLSHLSYMSRLGLWGPGTVFDSAAKFVRSLDSRGVGVMEMLAMDLKSRGMFLARALSYEGADFEMTKVDLPKHYDIMYDEAVNLWADLQPEFAAMKTTILQRCLLTEKESKSVEFSMRNFWSAHLRFFQQLCMGAKVDRIVQEAQQALADGNCVVVGLQSTGASGTESFIDSGLWNTESMISTAAAFLHNVIHKTFKVGDEFEAEQDALPELEEVRKRFDERLKKLMPQLPLNPLDEIVDRLGGPKKVAEMTGRSHRIVRVGKNFRHEARTKGRGEDSINIAERKQFQSGRKLVAILSDASSTGISLQADRRVKNQRRRVHITLELPWSADKSVQQLGRSHRSNQSSAPIFKLLISSIGPEYRFASAVAARLQQLGALTKGDRNAATGDKGSMAEFNVETQEGKDAMKQLIKRVYNVDRFGAEVDDSCEPIEFFDPNLTMEEFCDMAQKAFDSLEISDLYAKEQLEVKKFLNRIFGIQLSLQNEIFGAFLALMRRNINVAKTNQTYTSDKIVDMHGKLDVSKEQNLWKNENGGSVEMTRVSQDRGISWEEAIASYHAACKAGRPAFFVKTKSAPFGYPQEERYKQYSLCIGMAKSGLDKTQWYSQQKPHLGVTAETQTKKEIMHKNLQVTSALEMATCQAKWQRDYERAGIGCMHRNCSDPGCDYGSRKKEHLVLTGSLFGIWPAIDRAVKDSKVVRLEAGDDKRVVGLRIPKMLEGEVMAGIENVKKKLDSADKADGGEVTPPARDSEAPSKKQKLDNGQAKGAIAGKPIAAALDVDSEILKWGEFTKESTVLGEDEDRKHHEIESSSDSDEDNTDDEQVTLAAAAAAASYGTRGTRRRSRRVDAEITKDTIVALQNEAGVSFKRAQKALNENNGDYNTALCDLMIG